MFKVDFLDGNAVEWRLENGADYRVNESYTPTFYVSGQNLRKVRGRAAGKAVSTSFEKHFTSLEAREKEKVLRIDTQPEELKDLAYELKKDFSRSKTRFYNVDLSPQFRYCLENQVSPEPREELEAMELRLSGEKLANRELENLKIDGEKASNDEEQILGALKQRLAETDPDVFILSSAELVPLIYDKASKHGVELELGRLPGFEKLAGENKFESYGRVGHSPARYNVPGRAIIDRSNSFFWDVTSLEGMLDLVERSWKPIQETSWASIGNVLTAIEIRKAFLERDVLIPWNKWRPEEFKSVETLHAGDRGGFIFQPRTGMHENVHELDFSSLYPNIMITRNVSPDTLGCGCDAEKKEVPGLGYKLCERKEHEGLIPEVLEPLVTERDEMKQQIKETGDEELEQELKSRSNAIKWILVSCFGYQGYRNAKFGRIECHEAINAYAREIMLEAKKLFEENGFEVVHGIIDSLWVKGRKKEIAEELAEKVTEKAGIELEYEKEYDWIAFVSRRNRETGALNRYFGKHGEEFKVRGIEMRQSSTCDYVKECQELMLEALDRGGKEKVLEMLEKQVIDLKSGAVKPEDLLIRKNISKSVDEYSQRTRTVAALERYRENGVEKSPGEKVAYVVVDDSRKDMNRVKLSFESIDRYDTDFYVEKLVKAAESVLSPLGWKEERIRKRIEGSSPSSLEKFL